MKPAARPLSAKERQALMFTCAIRYGFPNLATPLAYILVLALSINLVLGWVPALPALSVLALPGALHLFRHWVLHTHLDMLQHFALEHRDLLGALCEMAEHEDITPARLTEAAKAFAESAERWAGLRAC